MAWRNSVLSDGSLEEPMLRSTDIASPLRWRPNISLVALAGIVILCVTGMLFAYLQTSGSALADDGDVRSALVDTCEHGQDKDKRLVACTAIIALIGEDGDDKAKAAAYGLRAWANLDAYRYDAVIADATESLRIRPGAPSILAVRAIAYFLTGKHQQAQDDVEAALKIDPANALALRVHAMLAALTGQAAPDPKQAGAGDQAAAPVTRKADDAQEFEFHLQVMGLILAHKFDEAILRLDRRLAENPKDADALSTRALVRNLNGDFRQSLTDADAALHLFGPKATGDVPAAVGMAWLSKILSEDELGQRTQAIEDCGEWIKQIGEGDAYQTRAWLLYKEGRLPEALADVEKALAVKPNDPDSLQTRGFIRLASGETQSAIADLTVAIERDPMPIVEPYWGRGQAFEKAADISSAVADYRKAVALQPFGAEAERMQASARARLVALGRQ